MTNGTNSIVKLLLAIIAIIAACLFTISKLHDDGTIILASMAEEYSVCTNVNACSDEDLAEMTELLINTGSANWYYDDDDNGNMDPKITLTYPSDGYLDVWVGTYDGQYCDATLRLETF